ncbi:DUF1217 domain-containing protein [uncultured Pelagimonas sp.]|uniref:DUF1217 domain-containing protein n=1 Tax=uncultured Pelagimonas sp. TaxID=1618102 RepID=UPI002639751F|nr:DUF1217 domain-containing protein [uncultured Pelagimonas sp.]
MSFQPVIVGSGLVGWQFLKSTEESQKQVFNSGAELLRDTDYFESNIASIKTAEDLVADRRLLKVALGAFGLQDDIDNKFFIKKILEEGISDTGSLANRMADERYKSLTKAFAFDSPLGSRTSLSNFPTEILTKYRAQEFEISVGNQDETLRLSMNFERNLPEIAGSDGTDDTKWFRVMGTTPIRTVFETALGLPSSFAQLDLDKQLETLRDKTQSRFGVSEIEDLSDPEIMGKIVQTYLLQSQIKNFAATSSNQVAVTLLQQIPRTSIFG